MYKYILTLILMMMTQAGASFSEEGIDQPQQQGASSLLTTSEDQVHEKTTVESNGSPGARDNYAAMAAEFAAEMPVLNRTEVAPKGIELKRTTVSTQLVPAMSLLKLLDRHAMTYLTSTPEMTPADEAVYSEAVDKIDELRRLVQEMSPLDTLDLPDNEEPLKPVEMTYLTKTPELTPVAQAMFSEAVGKQGELKRLVQMMYPSCPMN